MFGAERHALQWRQQGLAFGETAGDALRWGHSGERVSDDSYWKDFPRVLDSLTPRLLSAVVHAEHDWVVPACRPPSTPARSVGRCCRTRTRWR